MAYLLKSLLFAYLGMVVTGSWFDALIIGALHPIFIHVLKWIPLVLFAHTHSMK